MALKTIFKVEAKNYLASFNGLPQESWYGIFLNIFESTLGGACLFLSLYFTTVLHMNMSIVGQLISIYSIGRLVGGVVAGKLVDIFSIKLILITSLILEGVCFLLLSNSLNPFILAGELFFLGISIYGFLTANNLWVIQQSDQSEVLKLKSINLLYTGSNLGIGLAALYIGILSSYGIKFIFSVSGCLLLILSILLIFKKVTTLTKIDAQSCGDVNSQSSSNKNKKTLVISFFCLFCASIIVSQQIAIFLVFIKDTFKHISYRELSFLYAINPLLIIFLQSPLVIKLEKANKILLMGVGIFLLGFGLLLLNGPSIFLIAVLAYVVYTCGEMIFFSVAQLIIYNNSGKNKGQALGLYKSVYALGAVIGPSTGGLVYHFLGARMIWYFSGFIACTCFIICISNYRNTLSSSCY
ncbi:MAG: putative multidrug resistance protein family [Rickettsiaceae bacterium]|jgi:MFS family permease|nr:putative multidrug resistance protein family [Rickettsiaceae bacterium]